MMRVAAVIALFDDLSAAELGVWVARQWVRPADHGGEPLFGEPDIARVRLIHDLHRAMAIQEDTLPLVLSLIDQLHALRGTLAAVTEVLRDQPPEIQAILREALERRAR